MPDAQREHQHPEVVYRPIVDDDGNVKGAMRGGADNA